MKNQTLYFNEYCESSENDEANTKILQDKIRNSYPDEIIEFNLPYVSKGYLHVKAVISHANKKYN